jgi:hypothetical protein
MAKLIQMPDGQMVDIEGIPHDQVVSMIEMSKSRMTQPAPVQRELAPEEDYMTRENIMTGNKFEDALIGLGRFGHEAGQGIKQKGMMLGETLGLMDEGGADEYTKTINADRARYDKITEGAGMEDFGYYGGMLAPSLAVPALGIAGTAAIGGLEAGMLPTAEADWWDVAEQTIKGAAIAGGLRSVPAAWKALKQRKKGMIDEEVIAFAQKFGVKVPRNLHTPSNMGKIANEAGTLPIVGKIGAQGMRDDAGRVLQEVMDANETGVQKAFVAGKERLENQTSDTWKAAHREIGDAPIDRQHLNNRMAEYLHSLKGDAVGQRDAGNIESLWRTMTQRPKFSANGKTRKQYDEFKAKWDDSDEIKGFTGDTLKDLHTFRAKFGAANKGSFNQQGWDVATNKKIYGILTDEMEAAAHRGYGQEGLDTFQNAIDLTKANRRTLENTRVQIKAQNDLIDSESGFIGAALGGDRDRMMAMKTILGEQGAPAIRDEIANRIFNQKGISGDKSAARLVRKLEPAIDQFFGADEAAAMKGLGKFMDNIPNKEQGFWNQFGRLAMGGGGLAANAPATIAAVAASSKWLRRVETTRILQKLSKEPADSPLYKALTNQLTESAMVAMGTAGSRPPMQVDIRQGQAQ